jgi:multidrug resistance efflux pump
MSDTAPPSSTSTPPAAPPAQAGPAAPPAASGTAAGRGPATRWLPAIAFGAIALTGALVVLYAWRLPPFSDAIVSTENALVRGQVTMIGTQLPGYVTTVGVADFQLVRAGQLLATIDERSYRARREQAQAQLAASQAALDNWAQQKNSAAAGIAQAQAMLDNARAQAAKSEADLARVRRLAGDGSLSLRERDAATASDTQARAAVAQARAALDIAGQNRRAVLVNRAGLEAAVAGARAALHAAEVDLDNTRITAPADGRLGKVSVRRGAYVNAGALLMPLVPTELWVIANYKETQMSHVRVGQRAWFRVDALDGARLSGVVERIAPATGSEFSALPADNATGNYVKIAQRIPVRIRIDPRQPDAARLGPGMSVVTSIDTANAVPGAQP